MITRVTGDSEPQQDSETDLSLLMVGTLLCVLNGWSCYQHSAETQQVVIPVLLWISALLLLLIGGKQQIQEIFKQEDRNRNRLISSD